MSSIKDSHLAVLFLKALGIKKLQKGQIELVEKLILTAAVPRIIYFKECLSPQEKNCLLLAAKGLTITETAKLLNIKKTSVATHRENILKKLSCRSIAQAIFEAVRLGHFTYETKIHEPS